MQTFLKWYFIEYVTAPIKNGTVHWLIIAINLFSPFSEKYLLWQMIIDKHQIIDSFQQTLSLSNTGAHTPVFLGIDFYFLVKTGITTMLPLPNVFFSISDFTFLCTACYEYLAVISLIMFHLRYCLVVTIFAVIL